MLRRDRPRPRRRRARRRRAAGAVPRPVGQRHAAAHDLRRRGARPRQPPHLAVDARTRTRRATSTRRASPSRRSSRSRRGGWRRRLDPTRRAPSSPSCSRSSSRTTSGCTASATSDRTGLVTLIHPWECGLDTTPPWMRALRRMRAAGVDAARAAAHLARVVRRLRRRHPLRSRRPSGRPTTTACACSRSPSAPGVTASSCAACRPTESVLVEDVAFNAILAVANRALPRLADELAGAPIPSWRRALGRTDAARSSSCGTTTPASTTRATSSDRRRSCASRPSPRSSRCGRACPTRGASTVSSDCSRRPTRSGPRFPVPSVPTDGPQFDDDRYWKGPTWVNTNWIDRPRARAVRRDRPRR